jgi:hypothetical protein
MTYAVYALEVFDKEAVKLPSDYIKKIKKIFLQLRDNPYVGD